MSSALLDVPVDDATRRRFLGLVAAAGLLTACAPEVATAPAAAGYPRTVTTPDDGPVVLDRAPRRIVAMNGNRVIPFLLPFLGDGHELVGFGGTATPQEFPWIAEQLAAGPAFDVGDGVPVEAVAALAPDLLLANGNLGDYWEPVRAVGPLVQLPETDLRATVAVLGEVFAAPDTARRVLDEYEARVAAARRATPVTAAVLLSYQDDGTVNFRVPGAELPNFLAELNVQVAGSPTAVDGYEDVSLELVSQRLDVDWVVIGHAGDDLQAALLADPIFSRIPVIAQGRYVVLDAQQNAAGFPVTPPTVPLLLDALAPVLDA